jgi:hypothetical protein
MSSLPVLAPASSSDDLKKLAAAVRLNRAHCSSVLSIFRQVMKRSTRYGITSEKMTQEETQRCADSFGGLQAACNSTIEWLNV